MDGALAEMAERVGSKNLRVIAVDQRQVGGSLAGIFDMVADAVRNRQQFARKIRSLPRWGGWPPTCSSGSRSSCSG